MSKFNIDKYIASKAESFSSTSDVARWAMDSGVINENKLRYQAIREYYRALPYADRKRAKLETADHFCLSYDRVEEILYRHL